MNTYKTTLDARIPSEKKDCAVIALSVFAGVEYAIAHSALASQGRVSGQGTSRETQRLAADCLGHEMVSLDMSTIRAIIAHYPPAYANSHLTTGQMKLFPQIWEGAPDMLIFVKGHVAACIGGVVEDWSAENKKRVTEIWVRQADYDRAVEFFTRPVPPKPERAPIMHRGNSTPEALAKGPSAFMFGYLDLMRPARRDAVKWAIGMGITPGTAAAAYQNWRKARGMVAVKTA